MADPSPSAWLGRGRLGVDHASLLGPAPPAEFGVWAANSSAGDAEAEATRGDTGRFGPGLGFCEEGLLLSLGRGRRTYRLGLALSRMTQLPAMSRLRHSVQTPGVGRVRLVVSATTRVDSHAFPARVMPPDACSAMVGPGKVWERGMSDMLCVAVQEVVRRVSEIQSGLLTGVAPKLIDRLTHTPTGAGARKWFLLD
jgi:hypothetical protein